MEFSGFLRKWTSRLRLLEKIYNRIRILDRFDSGTQPTLLGELKFVILAYVMYNILVLLQKTDESIITC